MRFSLRGQFTLLLCTLALAISAPYSRAGLLKQDLSTQENEVKKICGTPGTPQDPNADPSIHDRLCNSAQDRLETARVDAKLWRVWAGVAAVCGMACAVSVSGHTFNNQEYICMGASVTGGVIDSASTKQFTGALVGISSAGVGFAINKYFNRAPASDAKNAKNANANPNANKDGKPANPNDPKNPQDPNAAKEEVAVNKNVPVATASTVAPKPPTDYGACVQAAVAGVQTYVKHAGMSDAQDKIDQEVGNLNSINGGVAGIAGGNAQINGADMSAGGGPSVGTTNAVGGAAPSVNKGSGGVPASCGSSGAGAAISCAVAMDSNLPSFVKNPKFGDQLAKATGMSPDAFMAKNDPTSALNAAYGGSTDPSLAPALASAIDNLQKSVEPGVEGTGYAHGGGGGGGGGGGPADPPLDKMVAGLMDQLLPHDAEEKKDGVSAVEFANKSRTPASIMEDPTLSLFDRVTYRYGQSSNRLEKLDWALPQNRLQMIDKSRKYD